MRSTLAIYSAIALLSYVARSQFSCSNWDTEDDCNLRSGNKCSWIINSAAPNGVCNCASAVKLDILFAVDTSGSIGLDGFQIQKTFLRDLTVQGIATDAKIGFFMFSTAVNLSEAIHPWETADLDNYVSGLYWKGGYTNTPDVIKQSIAEFDGSNPSNANANFRYTPNSERQQVLIMITDGNPCLPEALGGCPQSVCQYRTQISAKGIRVIIIGVGKGLNEKYVKCLTQTDEDFIPVASFSTGDFNTIMGSLSDALCPVAIQFKVTEVKAMRKPSTWTAQGDARFTRFVEIYNLGIDFNLNDITSTGFLIMPNGGPDLTVSQGQYVVFYDAADLPAQVGGTVGPGMPSCHLCGDDCDLSSCGIAGDQTETGYCWCGNSLYVACVNQEETDCGQGMQSDAGATVYDGCSASLCTFNNAMTRTSWDIDFRDTSNDLIDAVVYTGSPDWIETDDRFSYELQSKALDNDYGGYWAQSCSRLGTPGADPAAACEQACVANGCGGGTCITGTGQCDCDPDTGYYPQCTTPTSCTKCLQVPKTGDCEVLWTKNGTTHRAVYTWSLAGALAGSTRYVLSHYAQSQGGDIKVIGVRGSQGLDACTNCLWEPIYATTDYFNGNDSWGGFVQVAVDQCQESTDTTTQVTTTTCEVYLSEKTMCVVRTSPPTESPTPGPTKSPTQDPTPLPTVSPTHACPEYFWTGGTEQKICSDNDRCSCYVGGKDCCLLEPQFEEGLYDADRQHHEKDSCKLEVQFAEYSNSDKAWEGSSPGYLLTTQKHYFAIDIMPEDYECAMDIYWRFEWNANSSSLAEANVEIDSQGGWLHPSNASDEARLKVEFTVSALECDGDGDCYGDAVPVYGRMVIVNATSQCRPDCYDGRIYPMEIPVWFDGWWETVLPIPPQVQEKKGLPPWVWWIVSALVVFFWILALLLYTYWW
eukprot:613146_1